MQIIEDHHIRIERSVDLPEALTVSLIIQDHLKA